MGWVVPVDFATGRIVSGSDWNAEMGSAGNMSQTAVALASAAGQIPYATAANALAMLAIGAANAVLTSSGTAPQWSTSLTLAGSLAIDGGSIATRAKLATLGAGNFAALIFGTTTMSTTAYAIASDGAALLLNAPSSSINFRVGNADKWQISSGGHFLAATDNAYDIGASGATRPRTGYFGTAVAIGTTPASSGAVRLANGAGVYIMNNAHSANIGLVYSSTDVVYVGDTNASSVHLKATGVSTEVLLSGTSFSATNDNAMSCGEGATPFRWTAVYAVNGTIQTSKSDMKNFLGEVTTADALGVARHTARVGGFHRFTYKGDHGDERLLNYRHVGIKAEHAHEWLSPDGETVNPQTTASVALAAVAGEADAREADIARLEAEIVDLRTQLQQRRN